MWIGCGCKDLLRSSPSAMQLPGEVDELSSKSGGVRAWTRTNRPSVPWISPSPPLDLSTAAVRPPCSPGDAAVESVIAGVTENASSVPQRSWPELPGSDRGASWGYGWQREMEEEV